MDVLRIYGVFVRQTNMIFLLLRFLGSVRSLGVLFNLNRLSKLAVLKFHFVVDFARLLERRLCTARIAVRFFKFCYIDDRLGKRIFVSVIDNSFKTLL
jgi:hypothetical protein